MYNIHNIDYRKKTYTLKYEQKYMTICTYTLLTGDILKSLANPSKISPINFSLIIFTLKHTLVSFTDTQALKIKNNIIQQRSLDVKRTQGLE